MKDRIEKLLKEKDKVIVVIEGNSGSGKSALAEKLKSEFRGNIIPMDDFFLPGELRSKERYEEVGGNIHYERFKEEVIDKINKTITYKPFDCHTMKYLKEKTINSKLIIIEGVYALHPYFSRYYDLSIFLDVDEKIRKERILKREGVNANIYFNKWFPLENCYYKTYQIKEKVDFVIKN